MKMINLLTLMLITGCAGQRAKTQQEAPQLKAQEIQKIHFEYLGRGYEA